MKEKTGAYRYERKFVSDILDIHQVSDLVRIHPGMFSTAYPPRYVNNIYLDTVSLEHYYDNVNGSSDRTKVRIRWYGEKAGYIKDPVLEFKVKHGQVGSKIVYAFSGFELGDDFGDRCFRKALQESLLPDDIRLYVDSLRPVLINRYHRHYYVTRDERYRLTVDSQLSFKAVKRLRNYFGTFASIDMSLEGYRNIIVELKYDVKHENDARGITSRLPLRVFKMSKYVQGIDNIYNM